MSAPLIFLAAVILSGLSALTMRKTTALGRVGGSAYERRRRRRLIGKVLLVSAAMLFIIAGLAAYYPDEETDNSDTTMIVSAIAPTPSLSSSLPSSPSPSIHTNVSAPVHTPKITTDESAGPVVTQRTASQAADLLAAASSLFDQKQTGAALDKVNSAIITNPKLAAAYALRASIYIRTNDLDRAEGDYHTYLSFDPDNIQAKYNVAQVNFLRKKYDDARPGFLALEQDPEMGDLSAYKVFLCDLLGGHEATAAKELDAFNQVGSNASYYFANIAWSLYHKKMDDARDWQNSAHHIYSPEKFNLYASSLVGLRQASEANGGNSP